MRLVQELLPESLQSDYRPIKKKIIPNEFDKLHSNEESFEEEFRKQEQNEFVLPFEESTSAANEIQDNGSGLKESQN